MVRLQRRQFPFTLLQEFLYYSVLVKNFQGYLIALEVYKNHINVIWCNTKCNVTLRKKFSKKQFHLILLRKNLKFFISVLVQKTPL